MLGEGSVRRLCTDSLAVLAAAVQHAALPTCVALAGMQWNPLRKTRPGLKKIV